MTGADVQGRLDAIVTDLQSVEGRGKTINFMFRNPDNSPNILPISSDANGVVNVAQLAAVQTVVDGLIVALNAYNTTVAPVRTASESFKTVRETLAPLATTAQTAAVALREAQAADPNFTAAKTAFEQARTDPAYVAASTAYRENNISENIAELASARGSFIA